MRPTSPESITQTWPPLSPPLSATHMRGASWCRSNPTPRKWIGVSSSFLSFGLYSHSGKVQLPIFSVVDEFKAGNVRLQMLLRECWRERDWTDCWKELKTSKSEGLRSSAHIGIAPYPDIVIWSYLCRCVYLVEITVPRERNFFRAKKIRYVKQRARPATSFYPSKSSSWLHYEIDNFLHCQTSESPRNSSRQTACSIQLDLAIIT